ncbi:hypothetical protein ACFX13_014474 [Malus domestica]
METCEEAREKGRDENIVVGASYLFRMWVAQRPSGYAFVDFDDSRDADDAIRELDVTDNYKQENITTVNARKARAFRCVLQVAKPCVLKGIAETGKAYVHDFLYVNGRPVLIVDASKHLSAVHDPAENEKLCVFLIEKALGACPEGIEEILGIFNLHWVQQR